MSDRSSTRSPRVELPSDSGDIWTSGLGPVLALKIPNTHPDRFETSLNDNQHLDGPFVAVPSRSRSPLPGRSWCRIHHLSLYLVIWCQTPPGISILRQRGHHRCQNTPRIGVFSPSKVQTFPRRIRPLGQKVPHEGHDPHLLFRAPRSRRPD